MRETEETSSRGPGRFVELARFLTTSSIASGGSAISSLSNQAT